MTEQDTKVLKCEKGEDFVLTHHKDGFPKFIWISHCCKEEIKSMYEARTDEYVRRCTKCFKVYPFSDKKEIPEIKDIYWKTVTEFLIKKHKKGTTND